MSKKIIIGSRGSDLALWQAHFLQAELTGMGVDSEIRIITTKGDRIQHLSFDKIEGKGFFTKEIEDALLKGEIDVAVHSHKDLETNSPEGLCIAGVSYRENPAELLLVRANCENPMLPLGFRQNAVVGTSSARRKAQIKALRPDITIKDIRGNVPTRIQKLRDGDFDAILLAAAGVTRLQLDLADLIVSELDPRVFIPAPAQGVLAYQCREDDHETRRVFSSFTNQDVRDQVDIERRILAGFGGGCHIPIGVYARRDGDQFRVRVNYGKETDAFPHRRIFSANDAGAAVSAFQSLQDNQKVSKALITKTLDDSSFLRRGAQEHGITLLELPFIRIVHVDFSWSGHTDWVFFSSSNSVEAFFKQVQPSDLSGIYLAAYGDATARQLARHAPVDFVAPAGSPEDVAKAFAARIGTASVFFPVSDVSERSIASHIDPKQVEEAVAYRTELTQPVLPFSPEAIIFTSPSNVHSFFQAYSDVAKTSRCIAIGPSTAKALHHYDCACVVAEIPHEAELFSLLWS